MVSTGSRDPLPNEANPRWHCVAWASVNENRSASSSKPSAALRCVGVRKREPVSKFIFGFLRKTNAVDKVSSQSPRNADVLLLWNSNISTISFNMGVFRLEFNVQDVILIINTDVEVLDGRVTLPGATIW